MEMKKEADTVTCVFLTGESKPQGPNSWSQNSAPIIFYLCHLCTPTFSPPPIPDVSGTVTRGTPSKAGTTG